MKKVLNNKNLAFTLAEMMVVLALFSAISAATLPVMTAKNNMDLSDSATGGYFPDPWKENINGTLSYYNSGSALANKSAVIVGGQISDDAYALGYPQLIVKSNIIDGVTQSSQIVLTKQNDVNAYLGGRINLVSPRWNNVRDYGTIAIGYNALMPNYPVDYQAYNNIAIGSYSNFLYPAGERLEGYTYKTDNISIGDHSLARVSMNVNNNVAIGYYSGSGGAKGLVDSTLIGYYAGAGHYPGGLPNTINNLVAIGSYAGIAPHVQEPTVAIGYYAGANRFFNHGNIDIGVNAGRPENYSDNNRYNGVINIGTEAGSNLLSESPGSIISIGQKAGKALKNEDNGADGIYIGRSAGHKSHTSISFKSLSRDVRYYNPIMIGSNVGENTNFKKTAPILIGYYTAAESKMDSSNGSLQPVVIGTKALSESGARYYIECSGCGKVFPFDDNPGSLIKKCPSCGSQALSISMRESLDSLPDVTIGYHAAYAVKGPLSRSTIIGSYAGAGASNLTLSVCIGTNVCRDASGDYDVRIAPYAYYNPDNDSMKTHVSYIGYANAPSLLKSYSKAKYYDPYFDSTYSSLIISPLSHDYTTADWDKSSIILYANDVYVYSDSSHIIALNVSDKRLKKNIVPTKYGLKEVRKINIYEYKWKNLDTETPQIGVIAQEMQKIIPESVHKIKDGYLTVESNWILFAMISAVQELDKNLVASADKFNKYVKEYTALVSKVKILETEVKTLERENNVLANQINIAYKKAKKLEAQKRQ